MSLRGFSVNETPAPAAARVSHWGWRRALPRRGRPEREKLLGRPGRWDEGVPETAPAAVVGLTVFRKHACRSFQPLVASPRAIRPAGAQGRRGVTPVVVSGMHVSVVSLSAQRSLPALRQLTPDSAAFIQQSQQQQPPASQATTALTAVVLSGSVQRTAGKTAATVTSALQPPVISLTQPTQVGVGKQGQPTPLVCRREPCPPPAHLLHKLAATLRSLLGRPGCHLNTSGSWRPRPAGMSLTSGPQLPTFTPLGPASAFGPSGWASPVLVTGLSA